MLQLNKNHFCKTSSLFGYTIRGFFNRWAVHVPINHLDTIVCNNSDRRTSTGLVIIATLPILFEAALSVPIKTDPIHGQDRPRFVL